MRWNTWQQVSIVFSCFGSSVWVRNDKLWARSRSLELNTMCFPWFSKQLASHRTHKLGLKIPLQTNLSKAFCGKGWSLAIVRPQVSIRVIHANFGDRILFGNWIKRSTCSFLSFPLHKALNATQKLEEEVWLINSQPKVALRIGSKCRWICRFLHRGWSVVRYVLDIKPLVRIRQIGGGESGYVRGQSQIKGLELRIYGILF